MEDDSGRCCYREEKKKERRGMLGSQVREEKEHIREEDNEKISYWGLLG